MPDLDPTKLCERDRATLAQRISLHGAILLAEQYSEIVRWVGRLRAKGCTAQEIREAVVGAAWDSRDGMRVSPAARMANIRLIAAMTEQALGGAHADGR